MNNTLFNFEFEGKNIYSNIKLDLQYLKKQRYSNPQETLERWKKDLAWLLKDKYNTSTYFFKYETDDEVYAISIYEPNGNFNLLNNTLGVVGHDNLILVDLETKQFTETHTR